MREAQPPLPRRGNAEKVLARKQKQKKEVDNSWKAHYKRAMEFNDVMRPPEEGPGRPAEYDEENKAWHAKAASYYLR